MQVGHNTMRVDYFLSNDKLDAAEEERDFELKTN